MDVSIDIVDNLCCFHCYCNENETIEWPFLKQVIDPMPCLNIHIHIIAFVLIIDEERLWLIDTAKMHVVFTRYVLEHGDGFKHSLKPF